MFIAALFIIATKWKQPKHPPLDKCRKKTLYNGILFSHKTEGNPDICNNMKGLLRELC